MAKQRIEYAEGFIRDVRLVNDYGVFTIEIERLLSEGKWTMGGLSHLECHIVKGITSESINKRVRIVIEFLDETLDEVLET